MKSMAELEIPEAKDPFEKKIALTIAILAVVLSFVENHGNVEKTEAIIKTTEVSNEWAHYQAKALKGNLAESTSTLLGLLTPLDAAAAKEKKAEMAKEATRYDEEKKEIMGEAKKLKEEADRSLTIEGRCNSAELLLQIGVVLCSIAILVSWRPIFYVGGLLGLIGAAVGISSFMM